MGDIVSAVAVIGVLVLIIVWVRIAASRRNLVLNSSSALGGLAQLNSGFAPVFSSYPRVHFDYSTRVDSKAKFDRYNLQAFMQTCLLEAEWQVATCIETRLQAEVKYADYCMRYDELGGRSLGRSRSDRLDDAKYRSIEQKLYAKRRLRQPQSATLIRATVSYTSSKAGTRTRDAGTSPSSSYGTSSRRQERCAPSKARRPFCDSKREAGSGRRAIESTRPR